MSEAGMLVLGRKAQESVVARVGDIEIEVVVVRVGPNSVRLGFRGPAEAEFVRGELVHQFAERSLTNDIAGTGR